MIDDSGLLEQRRGILLLEWKIILATL